jgi:hypothetical protein
MATQTYSDASVAYRHPGDTSTGNYSLSDKAENVYRARTKFREQVIIKAREIAKITIQSVYPEEGYREGDDIESNQSANSLFVNALASKLMFLALPPDRPVLRFEPIDYKLGPQIQQNPKLWTTIEIALNNLEQTHRKRLEATNLRSAYVGSMKLATISGNFCWEHMKLDTPVFHLMNDYVVKRNKQGEQIFVILKRVCEIEDLDEDVQHFVSERRPKPEPQAKQGGGSDASVEEGVDCVDIYAVCKRRKDPSGKFYWEYWEEYEGDIVPGTSFDCDDDVPPLEACWMIPVYGRDWGKSYCEEYIGDLRIVDQHSAALNDGAAMASLILMFLKPGSRTSLKALKKARNMGMLTGEATDVSMLKTDKSADFGFVNTNLEAAIKRLGRAFLVVSSIQRQGERVTAEEWKQMSDELDQATGGMYSELAQGFQRYVIKRAIALHNEEDKQLPKLPPGIFTVEVITGFDAMGRTTEGENLMRVGQGYAQLFGPQKFQQVFDPIEFARRMCVSENVKQDGLIIDAETQQANLATQQQALAKQTLLEKGTGPAVAAMAKSAPALGQAVNAEQNNPALPPPGGQPALPPQTGQA